MPQKSRTAPCGAAEGRARFRTAQAYLEVAKRRWAARNPARPLAVLNLT
jgi:hypothetical protein